jgi:hypothetical protein
MATYAFKISGDTFTFSVTGSFNGNDTEIVYTGKVVSADKLEITSDNGCGNGAVTVPLVKAPWYWRCGCQPRCFHRRTNAAGSRISLNGWQVIVNSVAPWLVVRQHQD